MSTPTKRRTPAAKLTEIAAAAQPQQEKPPKWATDTPDVLYTLELWFPEVDSSSDDMVIYMTRSEFVALKQRLAELRGIPFDAERAA